MGVSTDPVECRSWGVVTCFFCHFWWKGLSSNCQPSPWACGSCVYQAAITWLESITRLESRFLVTRTRVSVEQIWDFCNPNPVQSFRWLIRSDPNPVDLPKYLIQSGLCPKENLWLSILLQWPMQFGYPYLIRLSFVEIQSELHNPDDSLSWTGSCSTLTRVTLRKMMTRFKSRFSQNYSTRVTVNDSSLESESFLQNLWVP